MGSREANRSYSDSSGLLGYRQVTALDRESRIGQADVAMARIDRLKEEIGWLKVVFGVLVAIDASLLGWLTQNYATASRLLVLTGTAVTMAVTVGVVRVNRLAYRRIEQLEEA
jgi:hypothetical protein